MGLERVLLVLGGHRFALGLAYPLAYICPLAWWSDSRSWSVAIWTGRLLDYSRSDSNSREIHKEASTSATTLSLTAGRAFVDRPCGCLTLLARFWREGGYIHSACPTQADFGWVGIFLSPATFDRTNRIKAPLIPPAAQKQIPRNDNLMNGSAPTAPHNSGVTS